MSDPCFSSSKLMNVDQAISFLLDNAKPTTKTEKIRIEHALGRTLAESLVSSINVPPWDNSAMDGYAVRVADLHLEGSTSLPISQRIPAGTIGLPLQPGTAARIFTGAPVPEHADTVIMQEHCQQTGETVLINKPAPAGNNIRRAGDDIAIGDTVLTTGTKMRPQEMGLAASVGAAEISVYRKLRVAIFSTGDELALPGEAAKAGQIYNSNRYTLTGLLQALGMDIIDLGTIADDLAVTRKTLESAALQADIVMTTGGVSVGEEDYVKAAIEQLGAVEMWRIAMKPGKPLAYGHVNHIPFIGLPGNPVSVFVTFCLFARPYLLKTQGRTDIMPARLKISAAFDWNKSGPRREFLRARLMPTVNGEPARVDVFRKQGSGVLTSTSWANGLVELPEHHTITKGEDVTFIPFNELLG
ncbi:MAG: molybdopterin molybdotransferase MoeA [Gammaproteobacteria bacterium]|nr:molybdopterin molybdotransferase MoeA [Gammaproteobacteria bacterium]